MTTESRNLGLGYHLPLKIWTYLNIMSYLMYIKAINNKMLVSLHTHQNIWSFRKYTEVFSYTLYMIFVGWFFLKGEFLWQLKIWDDQVLQKCLKSLIFSWTNNYWFSLSQIHKLISRYMKGGKFLLFIRMSACRIHLSYYSNPILP
jgi:hypothetical protein